MQIFSSDLFFRSRLAAELLGLAVSRLFSQSLLLGGGVHALGFFYDFRFKQPFLDHLISLIEVELRTIIKEAMPIRWLNMMRENAQTLFDYHHQPLLSNRIGEEPSNVVELIQIQNFYSFCHELPFSSTEEAGYIKLLKFEELEKGESIIRLVGTSQESAKELKVFLKNYDLLLKRKDHRKLGPELNLFHFSEERNSLRIFWHPKGIKLQQILREWLEGPFLKQTLPVSTPLIQPNETVLEEGVYRLRTSLLSSHIEFLKREVLSGADFPVRLMEEGDIYPAIAEELRWGLLSSCPQRVMQRTMVCLREQSISELISSLHFIEEIIKIFGFEAQWAYLPSFEKGGRELQRVIEEYSFFYPCFSVQEKQGKRAASRLELRIQDSLGRKWLISAVEVGDLQVSRSKEYVLISQQILTSLERLIALLLEKYEGDLPLWLAPEQVRLLVIGESSLPDAERVFDSLREEGVRISLDKQSSKLNERIYEAEKERVPYLLLFGEEERKKGKLRLRTKEKKFSMQKQWMNLKEFIEKIKQESLRPLGPFQRNKENQLRGEEESLES